MTFTKPISPLNQTEEADRSYIARRRRLWLEMLQAEADGDFAKAQSIAADYDEPRWC